LTALCDSDNSKILTANDLIPDPVLKRNIQRIETAATRRRNMEEFDEDDMDGTSGHARQRAQSVGSTYQGQPSQANVKTERLSGVARGSALGSQRPGTSRSVTVQGESEGDGDDNDDNTEEEE
jgi:hypothetical protein